MPQRARRLSAFVAASFALHVLTLVSVPPSGVTGAPHRGLAQPEPLHATLDTRRVLESSPGSGESAGESVTPAAPEQPAAEPAQPEAEADTRAGVAGGADVPFPDKWYSATEVDVRAEPIGQVNLEYPDELAGTGIPGRVHLLLFIDERGVVRKMQVTQAEPARLFDKAAMRAWTDVQFSPATKGGIAVKSQKLLELAFNP